MIEILYEDKDLIVCVKPVGVLSQPGMGEGEDMITLLTRHLEENQEKPYIGLIHRLDRNVGGVMVFSKKQVVTSKLSTAIQEKNFTKEYMAVVHNKPEEPTGIYKDLLFKDSAKNKSFVVKRARKGVKEASLEYTVMDSIMEEKGALSLIRIKLHTGRTHQIRVQFSSRKMPLLGDGKYGSKDNGCEIALWSYRLAFCNPITKKEIDFTKMPPSIYPWNLFDVN
ncbi:RluA family pseudouridine synthase [Anaerocolumna sp.]|uniref:RluA family pseudouridine synthase n=1 Tax=Anaerocolumna sp. TaxID=2041569 RepID=UPI0028A68C53|nr:RluA family pseudouridine synthase [Anaerocolumna sp.]